MYREGLFSQTDKVDAYVLELRLVDGGGSAL